MLQILRFIKKGLEPFSKYPFFFPLITLIVFIVLWDFLHPPHFVDWPSDPIQINARVVSSPIIEKDQWRFLIKPEDSSQFKLGHQNKIKVSVSAKNIEKNIQKIFEEGDILSLTLKIKKPHSYKNPEVFDYAQFLWRQNIGGSSYLNSLDGVTVLQKNHSLLSPFKKFRRHLWNQIAINLGSSDESGVLRALLYGDESGLTDDINNTFRDLGLLHLLVISGMHFSVVAWMAYQLALKIFRKYPKIFLKVPGPFLGAIAGLIVILFYRSLCFESPALDRGFIATTLGLLSILMYRKINWLNTLFATAFVLLIKNPSDLFSLSFQFSFMAVFSLLMIHPLLVLKPKEKNPLESPSNLKIFFRSVKKYFLGVFSIQISLLLGLTPLLLYSFYQFQWAGFLTNFWAVPFIELVIVPAGLIGLMGMIFIKPLGFFIFKILIHILHYFLIVVHTLHKILPLPWIVYPPHTGEIFIYYLFLLAILLTVFFPYRRLILLEGLFFIISNISFYFICNTWFNKSFTITQIDVGQGDSLLIELPDHKNILVDGGGSPFFDVGKNVVLPFLLYERIPKLDVVLITHADSDHYLGLKEILKNYSVGELWWNGRVDNTPAYNELFDIASNRNIPIRSVKKGDLFKWGETQINILNPIGNEEESEKDNNLSVVLHMANQEGSVLFTGDLETLGELRLMEDLPVKNLKSDVLKVGHHGSKTSSSENFLTAVAPKIALIGVGENNRFHHPNSTIIDRYKEDHIPVYRSDEQGAVWVTLKDKKVFVKTMAEKLF